MLTFIKRLRGALRSRGIRTAPLPSDDKELHMLRLFAERAYDGELWVLRIDDDELDCVLTVERPMVRLPARLEDNPTALAQLRRYATRRLTHERGQGPHPPDVSIQAGVYTLTASLDGVSPSASAIADVVAAFSKSWLSGELSIPAPADPEPEPEPELEPEPEPAPEPPAPEPSAPPPPPDLQARVVQRLSPFNAIAGVTGGRLEVRVSLLGHGGPPLTGVLWLGTDEDGVTGTLNAQLCWPPSAALTLRPQAGLSGRLQSFFEDSLQRAGIDDEPLDAAYLFFGDLSALDLVRSRGPLLALRSAGLRLTVSGGRLVASAHVEGDEGAVLDACAELLTIWSLG